MFPRTKISANRLTRSPGGFLTASLAALLINAVPTSGQTTMTFSIDFQGPTSGNAPGPFLGAPDSFTGTGIDEGSILTPFRPGPPGPNSPTPGVQPVPGMITPATFGGGGTYPGGLGILPVAAVEVDALSYGRDEGAFLAFSVDEFAVGIPGAPAFPNVTSEGATGNREASADVFRYLGPAAPTLAGPVIGNRAIIDGNGFGPFGGPGIGLREPNPPAAGQPFDQGDNLDAVDLDTTPNDLFGPVFFSMDAGFVDPLEGFPANTGTAVANGFVGGDVVATPFIGSGTLSVYASATTLGLDFFAPDTDDLDALILRDDGAVNAVGAPFFDPTVDFILYSVRRGSAIIGVPDSRLGLPIEEGDILTIPAAGAFTPQIYIPAERMGLITARTYGALADDLDALDLYVPEPASSALIGLGITTLIYRGRKPGHEAT